MEISSATYSTSKRQKSANQEFGFLDRISVLVQILSFLPTKDAVATGIVSRRWKSLWTNVFNLDFQDFGCTKEIKGTQKQSFKNFIYRLLLQHTAESIHRFCLQCCGNAESYDVESWVLMAIARNVQEIYLGCDFCSRIDLPRRVFTCKSIVFLKLSGNIVIQVPSCSSVCFFPNLRTLHLDCVRFLNDLSARKLISSCSVLQNLLIRRDQMDKVRIFSICSPSLKRLEIYNLEDKGVVAPENVLEIDAPALEYLDLKDHVSESFLVTNMGALVEANIDIGTSANLRCWNNVFRYPRVVFESFEAFCNLKVLSLSGRTSLISGLGAPLLSTKFSSLTHLTLGNGCSVWHQLLPCFLGSSDHLEVLKFVKNSQSHVEPVNSPWINPDPVPRCLQSFLRAISIDNFLGSEDDLAMLKYILKNARVLEAVELHYTDVRRKEVELEAKFCILQKISKLSRVSEMCEITFS